VLKYAAKVFYDGRLGDWRYMQNRIKRALLASKVSSPPFKLPLASRTDSGVWCLSQVISFNSKVKLKSLRRINAYLPRGIRLYALAEVSSDFSPRKALKRVYIYIVPYSGENLDIMRKATELFIGKHDFWNFCVAKREESTVREVTNIFVSEAAETIIMIFEGPGFLNKMIRKIAWTILAAGRGKIDLEFIQNRLERKVDSKVPSLSPQGLILYSIEYPQPIKFKYDNSALTDIREYLTKEKRNLEVFYALTNLSLLKLSTTRNFK